MYRIAGLFISFLISLIAAVVAAIVLISTIKYGFESLLLMGLAVLLVLALGAFFYYQISPEDK